MLGCVERKNASNAKRLPALYDQNASNAITFPALSTELRDERFFSSTFSVLLASLADLLPKC